MAVPSVVRRRPRPPKSPDAVAPPAGVDANWQAVVKRETEYAFRAVKRHEMLDLAAGAALFAVALAAFSIAVGYTIIRGDDMVGVLLNDERLGQVDERILALTLPVLLLFVLGAAAFAGSWLLHARAIRDFAGNMEGVSRLRREADVGVSRTRTATHALEEYYNNARRAFRMQLWLSRTLFVVCLVLFGLAVTDAIVREVDLATLALGGGSVLSILLASATGVTTRIGSHLADATQVHLVVGGAARRVTVTEDHVYRALEKCKDPADATAIVEDGTARIGQIVTESLELIQTYAEPPAKHDEQGR